MSLSPRMFRARRLPFSLVLSTLGLIVACRAPQGASSTLAPDDASTNADAAVAVESNSATAEVVDPALEAARVAKHARDRQAILAMSGSYEVAFNFAETVSHLSDYELKGPYSAEATELVQVVVDEPNYIAMQHILVVTPKLAKEGETEALEPHVIKHWRQDWRYEDTRVLEYRGHDTWENRILDAAEARGTWTQAVFQVDDGPRYEGYGTWQHIGETSYWESNVTWRPLPRREYSKRSDYHVVVARNRHAITPAGWVHDQDNHKVVLDRVGAPVRVIAGETGHNVYRRAEKPELAAAADYWNTTQGYWATVRTAWDEVFAQTGPMRIVPKADGQVRYRELFKLAESAEHPVGTDQISTILRAFVQRPPAEFGSY